MEFILKGAKATVDLTGYYEPSDDDEEEDDDFEMAKEKVKE